MKSVFLAYTNNMACHGTSTVFTTVKNKYTERAGVRNMHIVKSTLLIPEVSGMPQRMLLFELS